MAVANVLTTAGAGWIVDQLDAVAGSRYIGWGTGGTTAAVGNTALTTEASEARVVAAETQPTSVQLVYTATQIADANKTINEAGLFSASAAGTMILSATFTGVAVLSASAYLMIFTTSYADA